ncbi:MAG: Fe-S cluster assembly protein SufD [Acidobacteriota bacterium]
MVETNIARTSLDQFAAMARSVGGSDPEWLGNLRKRALDRFLELGFPTTRQEAWRFTNVAAIARTGFTIGSLESDFDLALLERGALEDAYRLVFVNGLVAPALSESALPAGLELASLAASRDDEDVRKHLGQHADWTESSFAALNTALVHDGAFLRLAAGTRLQKPVNLVFITTGNDGPIMANVRNLIVAGESSELHVVETYLTAGEAPNFTNVVTEVVVRRNATVEHASMQLESDQAFHVATIQAQQDRDSHYQSRSFSIGAALARYDINVTLAGEGSGCVLDGLYLARGRQHVDHHTLIDHATPHTDSQEFYKGVLDGTSHGVFDGKIMVRKDAQKTNSGQVNRNLLLSETAVIDTKPQLEIYADDVKCTHGSTIGQLDEQVLFYMRSRGIAVADARELMIYAFASEVVQRVKIPALRKQLSELLLRRLPLELAGGVSE